MHPTINYQILPKDSRVLVTGASGFIGARLYRYLQQQGYLVRTSSRLSPGLSPDHYSLDLATQDCPPSLCEGVETIFHLAGKAHALSEHRQSEDEYRAVNTEAVRKLLIAAQLAGVKRFVFFSSVKAVGDSQQTSDETAATPAATPYGQSKHAAEQLVLNGGFVPHPVVIRPCMVYGNTGKGNLPRMIKAIKRGLFPPLPEFHNHRSMVHVDDLIQAACLAATAQAAAGQIYIVSDEKNYSTRELYDLIRSALGKPPRSWAIPQALFKIPAKIGDIYRHIIGRRFPIDSDTLRKLTDSACYSSAKIRRELGFKSQHTLQQTLPEIIRYLENV